MSHDADDVLGLFAAWLLGGLLESKGSVEESALPPYAVRLREMLVGDIFDREIRGATCEVIEWLHASHPSLGAHEDAPEWCGMATVRLDEPMVPYVEDRDDRPEPNRYGLAEPVSYLWVSLVPCYCGGGSAVFRALSQVDNTSYTLPTTEPFARAHGVRSVEAAMAFLGYYLRTAPASTVEVN